MVMHLAYTLTENDYIAFNKSHYSRSPNMRKQFSRSRVYMAIVCFFLPVLIAVTFSGFTYIWAGVLGGIALLAVTYWIYPKFYWKIIEKNLRKFLREGKSGSPWETEARLSLEDDGMYFSLGPNRSVSPYSSIRDIVNENGAVYIYVDSLQGAIIPPGVSGTDEFVSALKAKLPANS
jgi:hypothetical protein